MPVTIGTVSSGTLRTEDLLDAFADELNSLLNEQDDPDRDHVLLVREAFEVDPESEEAIAIIGELQDALNEYAPPYCYFGAHEGDSSDFGFWPLIDSLEEDARNEDGVLKVSDLGNADAILEPENLPLVMVVNDHGDVSLYRTKMKIEFEEVWSVV